MIIFTINQNFYNFVVLSKNDLLRTCNNCDKEFDLDEEHTACPDCGVDLLRTDMINNIDMENQPDKKTWLAILLAAIGGIFCLPGIGHLYVGKVVKGILILISGIIFGLVSYALFFFSIMDSMGFLVTNSPNIVRPGIYIMSILFFGFYVFYYIIWQTYDVRKLAKESNTHSYKINNRKPDQQLISNQNNIPYQNDEQVIWSKNITKGIWNPQIIDTWRITNYRVSAGNAFIELQYLDDVIVKNYRRQSQGQYVSGSALRGSGMRVGYGTSLSKGIGDIVFFHNGIPAITFYRIEDPHGVKNLVKAAKKSLLNKLKENTSRPLPEVSNEIESYRPSPNIEISEKVAICKKCNFKNSLDSNFCGMCRDNLSSNCSKCGNVNPPLSSFCNKCGLPLV